MEMTQDAVTAFYRKDQYAQKHSTLHTEHSAWKLRRLGPMIAACAVEFGATGDELVVMDVGGGAGLILRSICEHLNKATNRRVVKYALDLSPGMLEAQRQSNPDVAKLLNEDICKTSLQDREVGLTLMIDVLEHILEPQEALAELARISKWTLIKVPLDNNLLFTLYDKLNGGRSRQQIIDSMGHVQLFSARSLAKLIRQNKGKIHALTYTDKYRYCHDDPIGSGASHSKKFKMVSFCARALSKFWPAASAVIFGDFAIALVSWDSDA